MVCHDNTNHVILIIILVFYFNELYYIEFFNKIGMDHNEQY